MVQNDETQKHFRPAKLHGVIDTSLSAVRRARAVRLDGQRWTRVGHPGVGSRSFWDFFLNEAPLYVGFLKVLVLLHFY